MLSLLKGLGQHISDLVYPPVCLHCRAFLDKEQNIFCSECITQLQLIDPKERCPYCFSSDFNPLAEVCCQKCRKCPSILKRTASAFDYDGPASTLITHLKYGGLSYLSQGAGAYLAAQFLSLDWPMPDYIIPMPISSLRRLERGYNQSLLIAESLSSIIGCPVNDVLRRRSGDYSQAGLNHQQRLELSSDGFYLKKDTKLHDKSLLLIDDVMTTGSSLRCCAEALQPAFPNSIYALTVCRAI